MLSYRFHLERYNYLFHPQTQNQMVTRYKTSFSDPSHLCFFRPKTWQSPKNHQKTPKSIRPKWHLPSDLHLPQGMQLPTQLVAPQRRDGAAPKGLLGPGGAGVSCWLWRTKNLIGKNKGKMGAKK